MPGDTEIDESFSVATLFGADSGVFGKSLPSDAQRRIKLASLGNAYFWHIISTETIPTTEH